MKLMYVGGTIRLPAVVPVVVRRLVWLQCFLVCNIAGGGMFWEVVGHPFCIGWLVEGFCFSIIVSILLCGYDSIFFSKKHAATFI